MCMLQYCETWWATVKYGQCDDINVVGADVEEVQLGVLHSGGDETLRGFSVDFSEEFGA